MLNWSFRGIYSDTQIRNSNLGFGKTIPIFYHYSFPFIFLGLSTSTIWINNYQNKIITRTRFTTWLNLSVLIYINPAFYDVLSAKKNYNNVNKQLTYLISLDAPTISLWLANTAFTSSLRIVSAAIWACWPVPPPEGLATPP